MVSKIVKRTPTKPTKDRRSAARRRKRSSSLKSVKSASSIVITSINKSICACRRRLIRIFAKITKLGTPTPRKQGFHLLRKLPQCDDEEQELENNRITRCLFFKPSLPPSISPEKRTIFLDLDETLIHSQLDLPSVPYDFIVRPIIESQLMNFYVIKRPGVDEFLKSVSGKFEIVVFTAGLREYASLVLDRLDPDNVISYRLYRDSCTEQSGRFVKDLGDLGRDLKNVVLVDDNPNAYSLQPENALPVAPFFSDVGDGELKKVMRFFDEFVDGFDDVRDALKNFLSQRDSL
ncbi:hypothetical protein Sjap_000597 [Stephania japonica]|uniref:FCP1 homology domain-containing protein n=1 Tax=Stephania japonica TaxID=461633 RepID=A0AAP0KID4_9MAGN